MPDRLTELRNLRIDRVAFVPAGDNPRADVLIAKAEPERSSRDDLSAAYGSTVATIERVASSRYPDVTVPVAVAAFVMKTAEGRRLANAASVIHRAARR